MALVYIPAQLRKLADGTVQVEIDAATVGELVAELDRRFPGIQARLCDGEELRSSLRVSIDNSVNSRGLRAKVQPDSEVHFIPALGGG